MFKLGSIVPFNHEAESLRQALGLGEDSLQVKIDLKHGVIDRRVLRLWLSDLAFLPRNSEPLLPFRLYPDLTSFVVFVLLPGRDGYKYKRTSEIIQVIEQRLESNPAALNAAVEALIASVRLRNFVFELPHFAGFMANLTANIMETFVEPSKKDFNFVDGLVEFIGRSRLDVWFHFPFNVFKELYSGWASLLVEVVDRLRQASESQSDFEEVMNLLKLNLLNCKVFTGVSDTAASIVRTLNFANLSSLFKQTQKEEGDRDGSAEQDSGRTDVIERLLVH